MGNARITQKKPVMRDGFPRFVSGRLSMRVSWRVFTLCAGLLCVAPAARARDWEVGPSRALTTPAQAAAVVQNGDRVVFDPGVYVGCAIWGASRLTLEARPVPPGMKQTVMTQAIVTGPACADRALFMFLGNDIVVRGLVFLRARDTQHNGAGILMEGANLTVEGALFQDNENGILAGGPAHSVVRVRASWFRGNGACQGPCAHAIYVGAGIARLEVTGTTIIDTHLGHGIKSRARSTIVRDCRIEDGPTGTSSYLIELPNGGEAEIANNRLTKGSLSDNRDAAISFGTQNNSNPTPRLEIRGNRFANELPERVTFVRNGTATPATLKGNIIAGPAVALTGPGTVER